MGMRRRLDSLLRKGFKTSQFTATVNLAISRLTVLKNQRRARCSIARSDVVDFLNLGNHERALLRVEQVIKEQNMLDVYDLLEGYCHLMIERVNLIEQEKVCPEELMEGVSSLIHAATRCGDFPELQEIRKIFTSRFGKEFADRAVELRNNCGVNPKIIQKLSTRMPSLEDKMKVLKEIASDNNIVMKIEVTSSATIVEDQDSGKENRQKPKLAENNSTVHEGIERGEGLTDSVKLRGKYKDVAHAAQAAFESAAYAAAAARAAVELSRSESTDPDDPSSPNLQPRKSSASLAHTKSKLQTREEENSLEDEHTKIELKYEKIHAVQSYDSESKGVKKLEMNENEAEFKTSVSDSSLDLADDNIKEMKLSSDEEGNIKFNPQARGAVFDESDGENEQKSKKSWSKNNDLDVEENDEITEKSGKTLHNSSVKHFPLRSRVGLKPKHEPEIFSDRVAAENRTQSAEPLNINKRPISVRNKRTYGW